MGAEWERIEPIFDRFRFDEHDPRELINAVFYLLKSCVLLAEKRMSMANATRQIPAVAGPAHYHFRKWRELNLLQRLCDRIRRAARVAAGRDLSLSAAVIDTQSAPSVLKQLLGKVPRLKVIFADSGYKSLPGGLLWRCFHWLLSVVEPDGDSSGFDPLPKRWVTQAHVRVVRRLPPPSPRLRASSRNVGSDGPSGNDSPDDSPNHLIRQTGSHVFTHHGGKEGKDARPQNEP